MGFRFVTLYVTGLCAAVIVLMMVGMMMTGMYEALFLTLALSGLGGMVVTDIVRRRGWEQKISKQIGALVKGQNRLTQESARNRNDIDALKDGLADTAVAVQSQNKQARNAAASAEARMVKTIAQKLGALGHRPRDDVSSEISYGDDAKVVAFGPAKKKKKAAMKNTADAPYMSDEEFSDTVVLELLRDAVRRDRIDLFAQPVLRIPQRQTTGYELFGRVRARPGIYLPAERFVKLACQDELISVIDNLLLLRTLQLLRRTQKNPAAGTYFLNIAPGTLRDTKFMGDLLAFLGQYKTLARRLVFELSQVDLASLDERILPVLQGLSKIGCRFSVDHVVNGQLGIADLRRHCVSFLRLDARRLMEDASGREGMARLRRIKGQLEAAGIEIIVEKIESERDLREILDYGVDYGQGYLFGKPDFYSAYIKPDRRRA